MIEDFTDFSILPSVEQDLQRIKNINKYLVIPVGVSEKYGSLKQSQALKCDMILKPLPFKP